MERRTLIAGFLSALSLAATKKAWAQPETPVMKIKRPIPPDAVAATVYELIQTPRTDANGKEVTANVVVLKQKEEEKYATIWIGPNEAMSIQNGIHKATPPRPLSHDLMAEIIKTLKGRVESVTIYPAEDATYFATIRVIGDGVDEQIDSRPSDALALALRVNAPLVVAKELFFETTFVELKANLTRKP